MNHRQPEQLNNAQFPAESEPEYTLEEIMAEFGAPQEAEQTPEPVPEPEPIPERCPSRSRSQSLSRCSRSRSRLLRRNRSRSACMCSVLRDPASAAAGAQRASRAAEEGQKSGPCRSLSGRSRSRSRPRRSRPLQLCSAGLGGRRARLTVSGLLMLMQLLLVCYGQFSLQFLPFLSGKLQLLLPAALLGPADAAVGRRPRRACAISCTRASIRRGPCCVCWRFWTACSSSPPERRATPPRQPLCCSACSTP